MVLLAAFDEDIASINIRDRLIEMGEGEVVGDVEGYPHYRFPGFDLITLRGEHLYRNDLDSVFDRYNPGGYKLLVILSRHSSQTRIPTLTVHPTGNFGKALYGGVDHTLSTSAPQPMRDLLISIKGLAGEWNLEHKVSYEVTHHGPLILTPHLFIEIGSEKERWEERRA
ncbi:MAG: D-tyrosyl-tRNA(Tyr) deacylase, partial [Thermoplasmata archaeon]|nr:D-tyrosyl-tRNA(Tyr) deacylase [Thermoplasmata archaeon]